MSGRGNVGLVIHVVSVRVVNAQGAAERILNGFFGGTQWLKGACNANGEASTTVDATMGTPASSDLDD